MNEYLVQTKFAVTNLITLISSEEIIINELKSSLVDLEKRHEDLYNDFLRKELDQDENFNEQQMMQAFTIQSTFRQRNIEPIIKSIREITFSITAKEDSIRALAGALLQIAKQGISTVHGRLTNCLDGRTIKSETIKNIIWEGRNQSLHYEEGTFRKPVIECFNNIGIPLKKENLAKAIIDLLE